MEIIDPMPENIDSVMEGYLRLLETIADNRCRNYRRAYRACLEDPVKANYSRLHAAEEKLASAPTNYTDGEIKALAKQVEREVNEAA